MTLKATKIEKSQQGRKVDLGFCPKCNEGLLRLGNTIGATQLKGCPKCRQVYF